MAHLLGGGSSILLTRIESPLQYFCAFAQCNNSCTTLSEIMICCRYWLYAAVRFKCMLVTNDEMRDHLFQLLGNDYFPKWKERHQVRRNEGLALTPCNCYLWVIWNLAFLFRNKTKKIDDVPVNYLW